MRLEFGECHFDWIKIGAVWRQEQEPSAAFFEDGFGFVAFMAGQVVEDHNVAWLERWRELGLDIDLEDVAVHRAVNDPRRGQSIMPQGRDKSLGAPVTERGFHFQPRTASCAATQAGHFGRGSSLIDKHQPVWAFEHPRLPMRAPDTPRTDNISAFGFDRQQCFF